MGTKETRWQIVIEGAEEYLDSVKMIQTAAEQTTKNITQLNKALKGLIELRKETFPVPDGYAVIPDGMAIPDTLWPWPAF